MSLERPRAKEGRAPYVFRPGGWIPMREHPDSESVDFVIVGAGAGGATLGCKLAEAGFSTVIFDVNPVAASVNRVAGRACRPLGLPMTSSTDRTHGAYLSGVGRDCSRSRRTSESG